MRQGEPTTGLEDALRWLSVRHVGATLIEFIERLSAHDAEKARAAVREIEHLAEEERRRRRNASRLYAGGWILGIAALVICEIVAAHQMHRSLLVPIQLASVALIGGIAWYLGRCEMREADAISCRRFKFKEKTFRDLQVAYDETGRSVRALTGIRAKQEQSRKELELCEKVWEELKLGTRLAREAGIDISFLERTYHYRNPILTGALTVDALLDAKEVERIFREMVKVGLGAHTLEAIIIRHADSGALPLTSRVIDQARARVRLGI